MADIVTGFDFGLSPLARGTRCSVRLVRQPGRFIPAGAGNSARKMAGLPASSVYPRWRGELTPLFDIPMRNYGLSPLARGTPSGAWEYTVFIRFIPAGAGNSVKYCSPSWIRKVYPRWRGELEGQPFALHVDHGLSPLARGTH